MRGKRGLLSAALVVNLVLILSLLPGVGHPYSIVRANGVTLNEIRINQPSTDNDEYFELAGSAATSLDGLTYLVIGDGGGGSGTLEAVIDLTGQTIPGSEPDRDTALP